MYFTEHIRRPRQRLACKALVQQSCRHPRTTDTSVCCAALHSAALTSLLSGPQLYSTQTAHCYLPSPHTLTGSGLVNGHPSRQQLTWSRHGEPWLLNLPSSDFNLKMTGGVALWASRCLVLVLTEQESWGYFDMLAICSFSWYCSHGLNQSWR